MFISINSILGWASFCMNYCIDAFWHGGNHPVALRRCNGSPGCLIVAFSHLYCWVGCLSSSSWQYLIDSLWGSGQASLAGQSSTVTPWSLNQLLVPLAVWAGAKSCWKWNQHLHKACQQKEAWGALRFVVDGCVDCGLRNTVDQHQQMTWQPKSSLTVETSHWTSSNMDSVPLHSSFPPLSSFPNEMTNLL